MNDTKPTIEERRSPKGDGEVVAEQQPSIALEATQAQSSEGSLYEAPILLGGLIDLEVWDNQLNATCLCSDWGTYYDELRRNEINEMAQRMFRNLPPNV